MKKQVVVLTENGASCSAELLDRLRQADILTTVSSLTQAVTPRGTSEAQYEPPDMLAVIYELPSDIGVDELKFVLDSAQSSWPLVPVVACRSETVGRLLRRTNVPTGEQLKRLGFRALAESPAQLPALLRHLEGALGTGELKMPEAFKSLPESCAFSLPKSVRGEDLRGAFAFVVSLHLAANQKEAAQTSLAGIARLIHADRWSIFLTQTSSANQTILAPLVFRTAAGNNKLAFDEDWWRELFEELKQPDAPATRAAYEAVNKIEPVKKREGNDRVVAAPLVSNDRVIGVLEGIRSRSGARSFSRAEISLLEPLSISISAALANSVRIAEAERLSLTDELTRLYNARYLRQFLVNEIKRARRYGSSVAAVFLDLDDFKRVNDLYGHLAGSHVLMELAALILPSVRDTDCVVRYGGDEFLIILPDALVEDASQVAERIRTKIERNQFTGGRRLRISLTASLGVSAFPQHALSPQQLITSSDRAMYQAKAASKNCVRIASNETPSTTRKTDSEVSVPAQFQRIPDQKLIS